MIIKPASLTIVCVLFAGASAQAQSATEAAKALAGSWEISNSDRDRICPLTLKTDAVKGGFKVEFDKTCVTTFPMTRDVQAWTVTDDTIRFIDGRGRAVLEVSEVESGMYEGERPGEGLVFLQNAAAAQAPFRTPDQMFGNWQLARGGSGTFCNIVLSNRTVGQDAYALELRQPCDESVTRFNPTSWRMDQGEVVLAAANGAAWRFEEGEGGNWRRVPESAEPLTMSRK